MAISWNTVIIVAIVAFVFLGMLFLIGGLHNIDIAWNYVKLSKMAGFGINDFCDVNLLGTHCSDYSTVYRKGFGMVFIGAVSLLAGGVAAGAALARTKKSN